MSNAYMSPEVLWILLPEIVLVALATCVYVGGALRSDRIGFNVFALIGLCVVGWALYWQGGWSGILAPELAHYERGPLTVDFFAYSVRWVAWLIGFLFVLAAWRAGPDELSTEYLGSLLLVIAGLMLVASATELVLLFLGLELISIPTYILLYLGRRDTASHEAATKYFFLSILSSALMLYGFSFLYGVTGSTSLSAIYESLAASDPISGGLVRLAPLAMVLITAGLGFKMAAVPFHFYAPDVYQGTTGVNAGLLAVVPKVAGLVVLVRLLVVAMPSPELARIGWHLSLAIAVVTMTLGNVLALWQQNIRRMLAYSSIAHAGYMFMGLAVGFVAVGAKATGNGSSTTGIDGIAAALFYLLVYVLATLGTFAALAYLAEREREIDGVDELAGLGRTHPLVALSIAVFMFSLTGLPPLAGFWGKLTLFMSALSVEGPAADSTIRFWFVGLAIAAALNAAISAGYYLRVVAVMYFRSPERAIQAEGGAPARLAAVVAAVLVIAAGIFSNALVSASHRASQSARSVHGADEGAEIAGVAVSPERKAAMHSRQP